jgi:UDP-GlcNAc:undecaprenyl-phosphate GlcNAc-1-phosphate transferase
VLYQRVSGGMNWFRATRNHVHHRLLDIGFDHYETVVIIYVIQALLVISAVLARYESDLSVTLIYAAVIGALFFGLQRAERRGWHVRRARGVESRLSRVLSGLKESQALNAGSLAVITILAPTAMLLSAVSVAHIPSDFSATAALLAFVPAVQLLWPQAFRPALLRLTIYATAIFPAYLLISSPSGAPASIQFLSIAAIIVLAAAIAVHVIFSKTQRFGSTPTDYLIVFGLAALMVWGSIEANSRNVVEAVLFATVLMYGCEIIVGSDVSGPGRRRVLQYSTLGALLILALRGVL